MNDKPSMAEAAKIRDVQKRHAYVFDNGLCSPDFFDLDKRMASEEFALLRKHCDREHSIYEAGCFTGLNLLGLAKEGYLHLDGCDFVPGAIDWLNQTAYEMHLCAHGHYGWFYNGRAYHDRIICFDVLEHQLNVGMFLSQVVSELQEGGQALFLVPEAEHFNDCGHVAWFPNAECLRNVLDYHFDVLECRRLETTAKLFAVCQRRD